MFIYARAITTRSRSTFYSISACCAAGLFVILDQRGYSVASVSKELFHMTDTYVIQVNEPEYALDALMFVLAIDAEKCSRT